MAWAEALFKSATLHRIDANGGLKEEPIAASLATKQYVGVYFGASWCGYCTRFSPLLAGLYCRMKAVNPDRFEVVYVSCDRSEADFVAQASAQPWATLPWPGMAELSGQLRLLWAVKFIPKLVILEGQTGRVINDNAVEDLRADVDGVNFPWGN